MANTLTSLILVISSVPCFPSPPTFCWGKKCSKNAASGKWVISLCLGRKGGGGEDGGGGTGGGDNKNLGGVLLRDKNKNE